MTPSNPEHNDAVQAICDAIHEIESEHPDTDLSDNLRKALIHVAQDYYPGAYAQMRLAFAMLNHDTALAETLDEVTRKIQVADPFFPGDECPHWRMRVQ